MRALPEKPSLSHLRSQAKTLLAGMRETDPQATLTDARTLLATEHGFRTWAELKAEVDRRRIEATTANPQLAAELARLFALGDLAGPMVLVEETFREDTWRLPTSSGLWALKRYMPWFLDDGEEALRLQDAALEAGIRLPRPVRSAARRVTEEVEGRNWRAFEWVEAGRPLPSTARERLAYAMGATLGSLHSLALPASPPTDWLMGLRTEAHWAELAREVRSHAPRWLGAFDAALPHLIEVGRVVASEPDGPVILCHSDLGQYSVRADSEGNLTLFNWEFTGGQPAAWEFGYVLEAWTEGLSGTRLDDVASLIARGYKSAGGDLPQDLGMFAGRVAASLNWIANRVQDSMGQPEPRSGSTGREVALILAQPPTVERLESLLKATATAGLR